MALFNTRFYSEALGQQMEALVVLPQPASPAQIGVHTPDAPRSTWPCLWLLHGLSDDHSIWLRRTSIERYAEAAGCAVVMPNAQRSFYCDMKHGGRFWTHLTEELPALMRSFFPLSPLPADNAVAGLSMGGYGAAKWLLRHPGRFLAGASLSGVMDISERVRRAREDQDDTLRQDTLSQVFGDTDPAGTEDDLFHLATRAATLPSPPPLLQICGAADFLYEDNLRFRDHARSVGLPVDFREKPGDHEWGFWDQEIQTVLAWLADLGFGQRDR